jgi:molybdate transport repressor ModE-like protein
MSPKDRGAVSLVPDYKLWFERDGQYIFGPGAYAILKSIHEEGTITQGAMKLKMSYRYAWGVIKKIEKKLGITLVDTFKGGTDGGGGARITEQGLKLMEMYADINSAFRNVLDNASRLDL